MEKVANVHGTIADLKVQSSCMALRQALIILLFISAINLAEASGNRSNEMNFNGEPQYTIVAQTSDTNVDPGSNFKAELFISGAGDVNLSKISVSIPRYIVKGSKAKLTILNYRIIDPGNRTVNGELEVKNIDPQFYLLLPDIWYMLPSNDNDYFSGEPKIFGESTYIFENGTHYAPYTIEFTVANNATAGDHDIFINYIYKHSNKWFQDTKIIRLHIRPWYERDFARYAFFATAIWAIISILYWIKKYLLPWLMLWLRVLFVPIR